MKALLLCLLVACGGAPGADAGPDLALPGGEIFVSTSGDCGADAGFHQCPGTPFCCQDGYDYACPNVPSEPGCFAAPPTVSQCNDHYYVPCQEKP